MKHNTKMFIEKKKSKRRGGKTFLLLYLQQLCLINLLYIEYVEYKYEKKKTTRAQHNKTQRAELNSILHFYYPLWYPHTSWYNGWADG